jgi:hypothetical protein
MPCRARSSPGGIAHRRAAGRHEQVDLCSCIGTLVQFGWEKALGRGDELGWWCDRRREGARRL